MYSTPIFDHHNATAEWLQSLPKEEVSTYTQSPNGDNLQVTQGLPTTLNPNATHNAISFRFDYTTHWPWDRGHWDRYLVFDVPPATFKHIHNLATICVGNIRLRYNSDNDTAPSDHDPITSLQSADAAMLTQTGISAINSAPLRTLLLTIAERASICLLFSLRLESPPNPAFIASLPSYLALVRHLALAGPPDMSPGLQDLRHWLNKGWETGPFPPCAVQAALVKNKWREYEPRVLQTSLHGNARNIDIQGMDARAGERELIHVLGEIGFLKDKANRTETLRTLAVYEAGDLMRYVTIESGAIPFSTISKAELCVVLPASVGNADMVRFLVDARGEDGVTRVFDLNAVAHKKADIGPRTTGTALEYAIRSKKADVVKMLLDEGAGMVPDFYGVTPLAQAKATRDENRSRKHGDDVACDEIVRLLEAWLKDRGLRRNYVDERVIVDEEEEEETV